MGAFDNVTLLPCPADIDDYEAIVGGAGGNPCTPAEAALNTLYKTDYIGERPGVVVFKETLVAGRKYRISVETERTQGELENSHAELYVWSPTDWPGETTGDLDETYKDESDEDSGTQWCPHNYKLNVEIGEGWWGGRRYEFTADETGEWVFMFTDGEWPTP